MEKPAAIAPLISEKNGKMRVLAGEVAQLRQELQEISGLREDHIQHMGRECIHRELCNTFVVI